MKTYKIAVIAGDGIGREVVPEGIRVLEAAAHRFDISFSWQHFDWCRQTYLKSGRMMPEDGLDQLLPFDAIYLGAVGYPRRKLLAVCADCRGWQGHVSLRSADFEFH